MGSLTVTQISRTPFVNVITFAVHHAATNSRKHFPCDSRNCNISSNGLSPFRVCEKMKADSKLGIHSVTSHFNSHWTNVNECQTWTTRFVGMSFQRAGWHKGHKNVNGSLHCCPYSDGSLTKVVFEQQFFLTESQLTGIVLSRDEELNTIFRRFIE